MGLTLRTLIKATASNIGKPGYRKNGTCTECGVVLYVSNWYYIHYLADYYDPDLCTLFIFTSPRRVLADRGKITRIQLALIGRRMYLRNTVMETRLADAVSAELRCSAGRFY